MNRKKILIFKDDLTANGGVADIVRNYSRFDQSKFEIIIVVWNGYTTFASKKLQDAGINVIFDNEIVTQKYAINKLSLFFNHPLNPDIYFKSNISVIPEYILKLVNWLNQIINVFKPDYVHSFDHFSELIIGIALTLNNNSHNLKFFASRISSNVLIDNKLTDNYKFFILHVQPLIDKFIVNSDFVKNQLIEYEKIDQTKIVKIYNGVDSELFIPPLNKNTANHNITIISMLATISIDKGYEDVFHSLNFLSDIGINNWKFIYAGFGANELNNQMVNDILLPHLKENILYCGIVDDVLPILNNSHIFILPSHTESLPNSIIEAMLCELPVISTAIGGIPELVDHGKTGLLIPANHPLLLAQAIIELINNPERARIMGLNGRERAKKLFSLQRSSKEFQEIYL